MKRTTIKRLLALALSLLVLPALTGANIQQQHMAVLQAKKRAAAAAPTWLVAEDMEGTGTPDGWSDLIGDEDWDYTALALEGSESWSAQSNLRKSTKPFTGNSEVWAYAMIRFPGSVASTASYVFGIESSGGGTLVRLRAMTNGTWRIENAGDLVTSGSSYSADTTYHIWLRYVAGSGGNSISQFYISTTATRPGSPTLTNGGGSATADGARIMIGGAPGRVVIDKVRVLGSEIGSDPS